MPGNNKNPKIEPIEKELLISCLKANLLLPGLGYFNLNEKVKLPYTKIIWIFFGISHCITVLILNICAWVDFSNPFLFFILLEGILWLFCLALSCIDLMRGGVMRAEGSSAYSGADSIEFNSVKTDSILVSCTACKREISKMAKSCPHCGHPQDNYERQGDKQPRIKNEFAAILSLFIPGLGQICQNRISYGVFCFFTPFIAGYGTWYLFKYMLYYSGFIPGLIAIIIFWILNVYDASQYDPS